MALVSSVTAVTQRADFLSVYDNRVSGAMSSNRGEIAEELVAPMIDEKIYVAVSTDKKDNKSTLRWIVQNSEGKKVCIIHVHQPAQMIPMMGTKFPASRMKEEEVRAYRELEKQNMQKILNEYLRFCRQMGALAEKLHIEKDCIENGIVELISRHGIRQLVMGAAADKHHSRKTMDLKSKKAVYVRQHAPLFCHIQFVCKGHLIHTREASLLEVDGEVTSLLQANPDIETELSNRLPLGPPIRRHDLPVELTNPAQDLLRRVMSFKVEIFGSSRTDVSSPVITEGLSIMGTSETKAISRRISIGCFIHSARFSSDIVPVAYEETEESRNGLELCALPQSKEALHPSSPPSILDGSIDDSDTLHNHLDKVMAEARIARQEAFQVTINRGKTEKSAVNAIRKAKASESYYVEELKQKKEIEESLVKEEEQLRKMKTQHDKVMEDLQFAIGQKSSLEMQVAASEQMVKELEQKIISTVELLQNYEKERDELQRDHDKALKEVEELRKTQGEASSEHMPQFFSEFSFSEIEEATRNFDASLKIGEGGYGTIHKGLLRHTEVAIKMPHSRSSQGPLEFYQEVDVLSKLRHPNLVTLLGACQEAWALIYEYLPNGSLEDRLSCKDNSPPMPWQIRIRIAAELCSALIFLHSCEPNSIIHGDLKPANILLDANLVTKLSDFGMSRLLSRDQSSTNLTQFWRTEPKGTFVYMDPEFLSTGEVTSKSDVYSFGIVLLQLLTGRPAMGIAKEVQYAMDTGKLNDLLDPLAGDWPFVQAEQLARLALRCCDINRESRPDLESDVWRVLEPMRISCGSSSSFRIGSEKHCSPPTYFICPIFQEVMQDPHVAADGFTYEGEALRGWLDSGRDTSPVTNLKFKHCNIVPDHVLRSVIQEWLQQH